jgi:2-polyprenyl-6-methoxyphenol hydroxylase-like FAD-dependent oxidoreductase
MEQTRSRAVIIGAGVGGLGAALALSRAGHEVTIIERDATPTPTDADAAFDWDRRGAPQVRHSHALLARLRNLLRDHYPDVLEQLLAAGATELRFCDNPPEEMEDRAPRDGDEDLVAIACRRTTFEWVLRRAVLAEDHVRLLDGVSVEGLQIDRSDEDAAVRVTGVLVQRDGVADTVGADVVVAATGRRSGVPRWLAAAGIELETKEEDTGIVYLSRFYRLLADAELPPTTGPIGGDLGYLKYAVFLGDNRTYSVTFAVRTGDGDLRAGLLDPDTFDAAARALPATSAWADPAVGEAITSVNVMGGLLNRRIRYLDEHDRPRVLGLHAVGDAHTCTNPLYGRGCSLAMVQADLLAAALAEHPDDAVARAVHYELACRREIEPWYKASVAQDRQGRAQAARESQDEPSAPPASGSAPPTDDGVPGGSGEQIDEDVESQPEFVAELMRDGLLPAVRTDPVVFRAFIRAFNLLVAPDALLNDSDVIGRVLSVYQDRENRPPERVLGPPRDEMLSLLEDAVPS